MTHTQRRYVLMLGLAAAGWIGIEGNGLVATAEAVIGRPVTPVSYAGVAQRSTVGVGAPGVGAAPGVGPGGPAGPGGPGGPAGPGGPGVGAGAPGVGATPANQGGPANRAGRH